MPCLQKFLKKQNLLVVNVLVLKKAVMLIRLKFVKKSFYIKRCISNELSFKMCRWEPY